MTPSEGVRDVRIDAWAVGGRAVGRVDGRVHLVRGAAPGDVVTLRILKDHGRFVDAKAESIDQPSIDRRPAPCAIQGACGGCPLMIVGEERQREAKRRFVVDALDRIGRFRGSVSVAPAVPSPKDLGYRNKIELTFGRDPSSNERIVGYQGAEPGRGLVDVSRCAIADPRLQPLLDAARAFFLTGPGGPDVDAHRAGDPLRLVLRAARTTDQRLIGLHGPPVPLRSAGKFAEAAAAADPGLAGIVRLIPSGRRRGGVRVETIRGRAFITEEIFGTTFEVPAATFLQVNPAATDRLGATVLARAGAPLRVLELYGGVGALGLALARQGASVTIVEADPAAVSCGSDAARRAGIEARFVRDDVARYLTQAGPGRTPDLVIADPPRTGLGQGVARTLAALGAPEIAMISCDPATLARDLAELRTAGYVVESVTPFDLFPQTAHVEAVAWLTRRSLGAP